MKRVLPIVCPVGASMVANASAMPASRSASAASIQFVITVSSERLTGM